MTHQLFLARNPSFLLFSEELFSDTNLYPFLEAPAASGGKLARHSFSEGGSIKKTFLCKTNPISGKPK